MATACFPYTPACRATKLNLDMPQAQGRLFFAEHLTFFPPLFFPYYYCCSKRGTGQEGKHDVRVYVCMSVFYRCLLYFRLILVVQTTIVRCGVG